MLGGYVVEGFKVLLIASGWPRRISDELSEECSGNDAVDMDIHTRSASSRT